MNDRRYLDHRPGRRIWRWVLFAFCLVLLIFLSAPLWLTWVGRSLIRAEAPQKADAVVVLAGDFTGQRILTAANLVKQGYASRVVVSGPSGVYNHSEAEFAIALAESNGFPASYFIASPNDSRSTKEEAQALIAELRKMDAHQVDVVTSDFHTRRAGKIFRAFAPSDMQVHMIAAPTRDFTPNAWWKNREGKKIVFLEWMKTLTYWMGM